MLSEPKRVARLATFFVDFLTVKIIFCIKKTSKEHDTIELTASHAKIHEYISVKNVWYSLTNSGHGKESAKSCVGLSVHKRIRHNFVGRLLR